MSIRFWTSLVLSLLVVAGCIAAPLIPQTNVPFESRPGPDRLHPLIAASSLGIPLPAGLKDGDMMDYDRMDLRARLIMSANIGNQPAGEIIDLALRRDGKPLTVPVPFVAMPIHGETMVIFVLNIAQTWLFAALGLLLLWRAQRQAAWAVGLWCLLNVAASVVTSFALPLYVQASIGLAANDLLNTGTLVALYLLADDLTRSGISAAARRGMRYAFLLAAASYVVLVPVTQYLAIVDGLIYAHVQVVILVHLLGFAIPLALLAIFYRHAQAADRARIRWVWLSILAYVASYLANIGLVTGLNGVQNVLLINLLTALAFLGFTYAVLRHRLVSLRLVMNRALVYGVITTLVVGVFAALSSLIDHFAVGRTEGALLQLLVPLSLGVTLNLIKKRLDAFVERLFFQRQFRAEGALSRLARECGFIENRDALLDRSADEILEYLKPTGVALYEKSAAGYTRVRSRGGRPFPAQIVADDPAMVSLRANLMEADLDALKSSLGGEGLAFPLAVRGTLMGALVLGQRPAEQYTQSERALLTRIAQQLAAALHALRAREAESFVDAVARGELAADAATRSRARQLVSQQAQAA